MGTSSDSTPLRDQLAHQADQLEPTQRCLECGGIVGNDRLSCPSCGAPSSQFTPVTVVRDHVALPSLTLTAESAVHPPIEEQWIFSKGAFRIFLGATLFLGFVQQVVSSIGASSLPEPLKTFVSAGGNTSSSDGMLLFGLLMLSLVLTTYIGLFVFWPPARVLFLVQVILALVVTPALGPTVETGWGTFFLNLNMVLEGLLLGLLFFSPLKKYLRHSKP